MSASALAEPLRNGIVLGDVTHPVPVGDHIRFFRYLYGLGSAQGKHLRDKCSQEIDADNYSTQ